MPDLYEHYKPHADEIDWHWVACDPRMTDDEIKALMGDLEPDEIRRKDGQTVICFYSLSHYSFDLLTKVRAFERERFGSDTIF